MRIGQKIFISKGNAGKGIWGTITHITPSDPPLYFTEEFNEALLEEEFKVRPQYDLEILMKNLAEISREFSKEGQRFGQMFYNRFDDSGLPFPELFYESTPRKAVNIIFDNYLNTNQDV